MGDPGTTVVSLQWEKHELNCRENSSALAYHQLSYERAAERQSGKRKGLEAHA